MFHRYKYLVANEQNGLEKCIKLNPVICIREEIRKKTVPLPLVNSSSEIVFKKDLYFGKDCIRMNYTKTDSIYDSLLVNLSSVKQKLSEDYIG